MKKKLNIILSILLIITVLSTTTVYAVTLKVSNTSSSLSSLKLNGFISGMGKTDWVLVQTSEGRAMVTCTNYGGNVAPGQNYPHTDAVSPADYLSHDDPLFKNGKSPFETEAESPYEQNPILNDPVADGGCPNANWTAEVVFILWDSAKIYAFDPANYDPNNIDYSKAAAEFDFACTTTPNSSYPTSFIDGSVKCTLTKSINY